MSSRSILLATALCALSFGACSNRYADVYSFKKNTFVAPVPEKEEITAPTTGAGPLDGQGVLPPGGVIPGAGEGIPGAPAPTGIPGIDPVPAAPPAPAPAPAEGAIPGL